jgi:hypothetical protein
MLSISFIPSASSFPDLRGNDGENFVQLCPSFTTVAQGNETGLLKLRAVVVTHNRAKCSLTVIAIATASAWSLP